MNRTLFSTQATALSLAALVSLTLMASINHLATAPAPAELMARVDAPAATHQVVVVTGKRVAHG